MSEVSQDLHKIAAGRITPQSSLDEIERVASIAKTSSESLKAKREAENARNAPQWELFKTLIAAVVPIVSLLTLYFTIVNQSMQLNETRRQNEETQWREFIKAVRDSRDDVISDPTLVPELKSFLGSKTIGPHVHNLAKYLAVRIADTTAFEELLRISFSPSQDIRPEEIVDLSRGLNQLMLKVIEACDTANFDESPSLNGFNRISDICNPNISRDDFNLRFNKLSKQLREKAFRARRDYLAVSLEVQEISKILASSIRNFPESYRGKGVSLKGVYLYYVDFSNIDFSGVDVTNATFDSVNLSGASFVGSLGTPYLMRGCNWWQARNIPLSWLKYLNDFAFPGGPLGTPFVSDQKPELKRYEDEVGALYQRSGAKAEEIPSSFNFNSENLFQFSIPR